MPAGKWDFQQTLSGGFVVYPAGPINLAPGEMLVRVEAWVMQQRHNAVQMTYQDYPPNSYPTRWIADDVWFPRVSPTNETFPPRGPFRRGPALGTAVAIGLLNGQQTYYWWTQEVELH